MAFIRAQAWEPWRFNRDLVFITTLASSSLSLMLPVLDLY